MNTHKRSQEDKYKSDHDVLDVLGESYENLYEHVAENLHQAEEQTESLFNHLIHEAKENQVKLKKISEEDANKVADWVKRDMADAMHYLSETGHELKDWLGYEISLVENELLDRFLNAADQTKSNFIKFKDETNANTKYRSGEVVGPSTLRCDNCGETIQFRRARKIPSCPSCHNSTFHRVLK